MIAGPCADDCRSLQVAVLLLCHSSPLGDTRELTAQTFHHSGIKSPLTPANSPQPGGGRTGLASSVTFPRTFSPRPLRSSHFQSRLRQPQARPPLPKSKIHLIQKKGCRLECCPRRQPFFHMFTFSRQLAAR